MAQQVKLPEQALSARSAQRAPTAQQAERAKQASRAIHLEELKYLRKQSPQVQTFLSNYNDPTELNSYIDALTNREAVSKKFGDTWGTLSTISGTVSVLSFAGSIIAKAIGTIAAPFTGGASLAISEPIAATLSTVSKVAAIPAIPAAIDVTYNTGIKPILAGKPGEAGLNLLMNLGETMDFSANPVKGLILDGPEGFVKGMGWSSEGRVNYDYDTGFFLTDMLLEMVTDPLNWVDMGTGVALKNATKAAVEPTAKLVTDSAVKTVNGTFAKTVGEITAEGSENILKQTNKTMAQVSREWAEASADGFIKQAEKLARQTGVTKPFKLLSKTEQDALIKQVKERMLRDGRTKIQQSLVTSIKKELPKASASEIDLILKQAGREAADAKNLANAMLEISDITFDTLSSDVIKGLSSIQNISDSYQRFMTKGAMMTSGYGLGVEVAKNGWYGIRKWANELTLRNLRKPQLFDNKNGLDIKQYSKAKNIWKATQRYVYDMTGDVSQRDINSFYVFMQQQFNRDKQFISKIFQDEPSPLKVAARLDAQFKELYGCEFKEYVGYIKGINDAESGIYKFYTNYLENLNASLESKAFTKPMNVDIKSGKNLFNVNDLSAINIIKQLQDIANTKDFTKLDTFDKLYTIKLNNAYVNAVLVKDKNISQVLDEIASDERIGALLDKVINDLKTMEPERSAMLNTYVRIVKEAGLSFSNVKELYNNVANIALQKVPGIPATKLRYYILDQIFGLNMSVSQALAAFDNITMPAIKNGLETLLYDKGFKIDNYPALEEQISRVLKQYLEAQQHANIDDLGATIVQDFTDSIEGLLVNLPQYRAELVELVAANDIIRSILSGVREANLGLLENIFTTKDTIFSVANIRKLTDAGLALNTIANIKNLDLFKFSADVSGSIVKSANVLGKRINKMVDDLAQYSVMFDKDASELISGIYSAFRNKFLNNPNFTQYLDIPAFAYLKDTSDTYIQFAQLAEFYKLIKEDAVISKQFKEMLKDWEGPYGKISSNIINPKALLSTDFAWEAMAQSAWVAEKQFNEQLINSITSYKNLSLYSKKITNDFQAIRDLFSANKLDRVKMLQQERYIKAASKINDMLEDVERVYDDLFDKELALTKINNARNILVQYPDLNKKYGPLIDMLERYWSGEKLFEQSSKSPQTAQAAKLHTLIEGYEETIARWSTVSQTDELYSIAQHFIKKAENALPNLRLQLKQLNDAGFEDTFTPFYKKLKEFNKEYIVLQQQAVTKDTIKNIVPSDLFQLWFTEYPEQGERILKLLTDPDPRNFYNLNNTDYANFYYLIQAYFKNTKQQNNIIPYNLIPVAFKNIELKYYYDILGIDDPNLIYELVFSGSGGWYKPRINAINAIFTAPTEIPDEQFFKFLQQSLRHESGHNVLHELFTEEERSLFIKQFKQNFIDTLGESVYNKCFEIIEELYQDYKHLPDYTQRLEEEVFTFALGNNFEEYLKDAIDALDMQSPLLSVAPDAFSNFSEVLTEQLRSIAESKGIKRKIYESWDSKVIKKSVRFDQPFDTITPWDPIRKQQELNKLIDKATNLNAQGALYNLFTTTPEEFKNELAYRFGFITFNDDDIADHQLSGMFKKFIGKDDKNLPEGVMHIHERGRHWFILTRDNVLEMKGRQAYLNSTPIIRIQKKKQFNEFQLVDNYTKDVAKVNITNTLNELDDTLETLTGSRLGDSQGEFLDKNALEKLFGLNAEGAPEYLPDEVWKAFGGIITETDGVKTYKFDFDKIYTADQFSIPRFNESILGTMKSKNSLGMFSSNMLINTRNAITHAQVHLKPKNEYVNTVFDSILSIASPNSVWANFSDEDLLTALQTNPEYKLVALVDDKKYGVKVREIIPTSITAIQKGKELGAVIIPSQTFKDMYNVVNHRLGSEGMAKLWSRIMYMYKFGYLCRPGAWIRNFIDTNLKSRLEMGGEYKTYNDLAHRILNDVDDMKKFIQARAQDGVIRSDAIKEYFEGNFAKVLTYEQFIELDRDFLSRSISGNIMNDLYKTAGGDLWNTFTELTGNIVEFGNKTENYNRLATYLYELDHGADYTTALSKLAKVHFDYSFKTKAEQLVEMVFPFTTFSLRNYSYWIEMLEKHPWIMRNYAHLMKPHWDFKDYTPEELARDYRVQSQILNGQLKLAEFNNKVITFKANPSIQDAIRLFSDPINAVYEKLAAPIATPLAAATGEYAQPENMLPIVGPIISSAKSMFKTGTPLPSAIGVQPTPRRTGIDFRNKNLSGINTYRDEQYRTPNYRKNVVYDSYATRGVNRYRTHMYPVIDIAHDIKMRYTVNVYNRIKNRVKTDVYQGIRYRIKLDANRFR